MKQLKKTLSILLVIMTVLTICSTAMPVFAAGDLFSNKTFVAESYVKQEMTSKIVGEVSELREEYAKHFVCEDGSYVVATYTEPVHYKENGKWKEIDNSLELTSEVKSSSGKAMYTPKAGPADVSIPQSFSNDQRISATNKGHTITFGVSQEMNVRLNKSATVVSDVEDLTSNMSTNSAALLQKTMTASTDSISEENEITEYNNEVMAVENQSGAIVYEDIFNNADLEYIVTTNSIKENIVVQKKQYDYTYSFDMDFGELVPIVNEDNSIRVVEPETEETVFFVAAPYMYDANGVESTEIDMSLVEEDGIYVLTLKANADWINSDERVFPVVIDPTVYMSYNDVFVMSGVGNKNTTKVNKELRIGKNLTNSTRTYVKPELPSNIPAGSYIDSAYLVLKKDAYFQGIGSKDIYAYAFDCYKIDSWDPSSITWNNQPIDNSKNGYESYDLELLSSVEASSDREEYPFAITNAVRRWFSGGVNNGIMLASSNESTATQVDFFSSRADDSSTYPQIYITYTAPNASISSWETDSQAKESSAFTITTSSNWTVSSNESWISLSTTSGSGIGNSKIIVAENTSVKDRTGIVTVKIGNTVIGTITVTQLGVAPSLILGENNFFIKYDGCTTSVDIVSNVEWQPITESSWISFNKEQINSETYKLNISISNNDTFKTRTGEIEIISDDIESRVIKITQLDKISNYFYEVNKENTELTLKDSSEYNHALATWAMYLSSAAYNPLPNDTLPNIPEGFMTDFTTIESVLTGSCFEDIEQYHYEESQLNTSAHTIAHKKIIDTDGSYKTLITVTIRGTTAAIEWLTDAASIFQCQNIGFLGAKNDVIGNLNNYLQKHNSVFEDEKIILITGHSMGAAVANLVGDALNCSEEWDNNNVYTYTFATPNVGQNITTEHINIFNILNRSDYVTLMPCSLIPSAVAGTHLWGRHGIDIPISMTRGENIADNHKMDTYYNFMISQEPTLNYVGIKAISNNDVRMGILPKLLSMKCPVGVTVYNSDGEIMAHESQQSVALYARTQTIATTSDVVSWITEDGEKVFFIPYGSDASLVAIEAYDYGNMTFSIANVDILNDLPNEIKTFKNVSLYPEKEFSVGISEYITIEDTKLYVVENGAIVDEITDLNPPLKSVSLDNTNISYGTPSTLTIETDKTVSEIKFINTTDGTSVTYSVNNGTGVTIFEDGNNLIWNIQKIFSQGSWIYDVAVKSEDAWYTTNKAFAITVY